MPVGVIVVLRDDAEPAALERCQAFSTESTHWYVVTTRKLEQLAAIYEFFYQRRCTVWLHDSLPSVSTARNDALVQSFVDGCQMAILLDQRSMFRPEGFDNLVFNLLIELSGVALCRQVDSNDGSPFSAFALGSAAYNRVGAFDENIENAWFSSLDYLIRARQSGISVSVADNVLFQDEGQDSGEALSETQRNYLEAKWGGLPTIKTQRQAFESLGCRISWEGRASPYGVSRDLIRKLVAKLPTALDVRPGFVNDPTVRPAVSSVSQRALSASIIRAVFQSLLHREPDLPAIEMYSEQLSRGSITSALLCDIVRSSDEYRNASKAALAKDLVE